MWVAVDAFGLPDDFLTPDLAEKAAKEDLLQRAPRVFRKICEGQCGGMKAFIRGLSAVGQDITPARNIERLHQLLFNKLP